MLNCDQKVLGLHRIKKPPNSTWHVWLLSSLISSHRGITPTSSGITLRDHLQLHFSEVALHSLQPPAKGTIEGTRLFPHPTSSDVWRCYVFCVIFNINILFVKIALFKSIFFLLKLLMRPKKDSKQLQFIINLKRQNCCLNMWRHKICADWFQISFDW